MTGCHETHFSTQHAQALEEARLPSPYGYSCWSSHYQSPSSQRPYPSFRLALVGKVHGRDTFLQFRQSNLRARRGTVRITFVAGDAFTQPCFAYAIGRRVGKAVKRNLLRRRLRAMCAELSPSLLPGAYLISVSPEALLLDYRDLKNDLQSALRVLTERLR